MTFMRFFLLVPSICLFLAGCETAKAHPDSMRIVVVGEDEDRNSIARTDETYKRVVAEMQQALIRHNIFVVDEDMIGVKLGFSFKSRRSKADLIRTLSIANGTTDASVQSRLAVVFSIIPNIQNMSITRKLTVRVRGQVYDLQNLRALSSFEVTNPEVIALPKKKSLCNAVCVSEKVGETAKYVAREVAAILNKKLHKLMTREGRSLSSSGRATSTSPKFIRPATVKSKGLQSVYTLKLRLMKTSNAMRLIDELNSTTPFKIKMLKSSETERVYGISTRKSLGALEKKIMRVLMDLGVNVDNFRFSASGTVISVERL